jgi:DNA-binding response OmpR family regulator
MLISSPRMQGRAQNLIQSPGMNKLLVIDDEVELGRLLECVAESIGYEARVASRIADFKDSLVAFTPGVIMLDLAMPEMDGLELLRWLGGQNCHA